MDNQYQKNMSLMLDALFLALRLTNMAEHDKDNDKLMRVTDKAWDRYNSRTYLVEGIKPIK